MEVHVKEAVKSFFLSGSRKLGSVWEEETCQICLKGRRSLELGGDVVGVVLQTLLICPEKNVLKKDTSLWLCGECALSLSTLTDLFLQLEELRCEFNEMRRKVGRQVIVEYLGRSEKEWVGWEEEARGVETIFPSCVGAKWEEEEEVEELAVTEVKGDSLYPVDSLTEEVVKIEDDLKLKEMTPIVLMEKLRDPSVIKTPNADSLEEETECKEEDAAMEVLNLETEDFEIICEDLVGVTEERKEYENKELSQPSPRQLRKRCIAFIPEVEEKLSIQEDKPQTPMKKRKKSSPLSNSINNVNAFRKKARRRSTPGVINKDGVIEYECKTCKSKFNCRKSRFRCQESHVGGFKCPYCDVTCSRRDNLNRHITVHHSK